MAVRLSCMVFLLEEAKRQDNLEKRRQAHMIRNLGLLTTDINYIKVFRLSEELIAQLEEDILPFLAKAKRRGGISNRTKVLCTLAFLASGSYQKILCENARTHVSQASASRAIRTVVDAINHPVIINKYIRFPQNTNERQILKEKFYRKFKIPGTIGCVDGTLVSMVRPKEHEERYYCRKGYHARNAVIDGTTPLILSAAMGHTECVRELLAQGADPACSRTTGTSALFFAAQGGFLDIARLLLDSGAAIDAPSMDGGTPLFVACQCGHLPVVEELIRRGADVNSSMKDKATPLFIAAQNGHEEVCRALLSRGAHADGARADRATPLWIAAQCGHEHVARLLLAAGARVDHERQDGATPLFKAAHKGHAAVVVELLKYKPNLGLLPNGQSALHGAAMFGQLSCVRLLARRSQLSLRNSSGLTALQAAAAARKHDVVAYLRRLEQELHT